MGWPERRKVALVNEGFASDEADEMKGIMFSNRGIQGLRRERKQNVIKQLQKMGVPEPRTVSKKNVKYLEAASIVRRWYDAHPSSQIINMHMRIQALYEKGLLRHRRES